MVFLHFNKYRFRHHLGTSTVLKVSIWHRYRKKKIYIPNPNICLPTRPEIWCDVAGIASSPASTFGIVPAHLETLDVRCLVSPSCAFCGSHVDSSLLLVDF